jgi:hypothetical protein
MCGEGQVVGAHVCSRRGARWASTGRLDVASCRRSLRSLASLGLGFYHSHHGLGLCHNRLSRPTHYSRNCNASPRDVAARGSAVWERILMKVLPRRVRRVSVNNRAATIHGRASALQGGCVAARHSRYVLLSSQQTGSGLTA